MPSTNIKEKSLPTCTDIVNALNTLASATTNPNVLMDLTNSVASFSVPYGNIAKVQLSSGGDAVLSVPSGSSIDGKLFKITVAGYITQTTPENGDDPTIRIWNGTNFSTATILASVGPTLQSAPGNFYLVFYGYWDSTSHLLIGGSNPPGPFYSATGSHTIQTVTSQSAFQFVISGQTSGSASDPGDTLTITKLTLELVA